MPCNACAFELITDLGRGALVIVLLKLVTELLVLELCVVSHYACTPTSPKLNSM